MTKTLLFVGLLSLSVGCTPGPDKIELSSAQADTEAYPFAAKSCTDEANEADTDSLKEAYADFGKFTFRWKGDGTLTVTSIIVSLKGSSLKGGKFVKTFGSTDLEDTFGLQPMVISSGVTATTGCSIRVGGIGFVDPNANGYATGTISLFGISGAGTDAKEFLAASTEISVKYYGKPSGR